ncbi:MAG: DNA polymerase III subunit beta [Lachnospiraceae bacterium]|nr:DNA polymerase III subunit beta [Lachnospiraceae bacterium]
MKLLFRKNNLLNGLQIASKAVPTHTTMPILQCILITAKDHAITLTANDMDMGIETNIEGEIIEDGMIALEAKIFLDIIRKMPDGDISIETDENLNTFISCEKAHFNIVGKDGDEFSYLPEVDRNNEVVISQFTLKEVIRQTIFSIAENDTNKIMGGELFEINDDRMKIVSLDGHRISIRNTDLRNSYDPVKVIVPGKTLNEINKILSGDADKDVTISFSENHIIFEFDNTIVISRLIEGNYFNVDQMISLDYETKVTINKREFLDCIDRATLLVKEGDKKPIIVDIKDGSLELRINSTIGSMNEMIGITKEGQDLMIGFNPKFLIDSLKAIDDESIDLYMVNSKAPCIIRDEEGSYLYLILPVNFVQP